MEEEKENKEIKDKKEIKRTVILVKKGLQFRYMGTVIIGALLSYALVMHEVFWVAGKLAIKNPAIKDIMSEFHALAPALAVKAAILIAIIAICSLILSNQIAAPIYKFEKGLKKIKLGDFSYRLYLRKGDQLTEVQKEFNEMSSAVHKIMCEYEDFRSYAAGSSDEKVRERAVHVGEEIKRIVPKMKI